MPWLYSISKHTFSFPGLPDVSQGVYSGGGVGSQFTADYVNNPAVCDLVNHGPIPPGTWTMTGLIADDPHTGPQTIVLSPDPGTAALCRGLGRGPTSFRIHGDSIENPGQASEGCIIAPQAFRVSVLWLSADKTIIVVP